MQLSITRAGRRFNRDWIFRGLTLEVASGSHLLIVGPNGSGKSTLLQCVSGFLSLSEGYIERYHAGTMLSEDATHRHLAMCAPYLEVFDDLTLIESIAFQERFRPFRMGLRADDVARLCELEAHRHKPIRHFSSGMRQRLKLALAILSDASLLLLDEPTSNLDRQAIAWYRHLLETHSGQRTVVVSSNHNTEEYLRADLIIDISTLK